MGKKDVVAADSAAVTIKDLRYAHCMALVVLASDKYLPRNRQVSARHASSGQTRNTIVVPYPHPRGNLVIAARHGKQAVRIIHKSHDTTLPWTWSPRVYVSGTPNRPNLSKYDIYGGRC